MASAYGPSHHGTVRTSVGRDPLIWTNARPRGMDSRSAASSTGSWREPTPNDRWSPNFRVMLPVRGSKRPLDLDRSSRNFTSDTPPPYTLTFADPHNLA